MRGHLSKLVKLILKYGQIKLAKIGLFLEQFFTIFAEFMGQEGKSGGHIGKSFCSQTEFQVTI